MPTLQGMDTKSTPTIANLYDLTLMDGLPVQSDGREIRYRNVRLRETNIFDEREAQKVAERVVTVGGQPRLMVSDADFRYALTLRHVDWMECDGNKLHSAVLGDDVLGKLSSHDLGLIEKRVFLLTLAAEVRYGNMTQEQFDAVMRGQEVKPTQAPQPVGPTTGMGANAAEPESGPTLLATYAGAGAIGAAQSDAA